MLNALEDQATVRVPGPRLAFTTDSYVVRPLFFPGGDIGKLAVHGTVNDLAVGGARPLFLSAAFILEEGLLDEQIRRLEQVRRDALGYQLARCFSQRLPCCARWLFR